MTHSPVDKARKRVADVARHILKSDAVARYLLFCARLVATAQKPFIIGVTGSVGKTTTTAMIAAVVKHPGAQPIVGHAAKSAGNMNDNVGLAYNILRYDDWGSIALQYWRLVIAPFRALQLAAAASYPKVLVFEYGFDLPGRLARSTRFLPPNVGVVTTIGPAHLETLRTLEGVASEKSAVVRAVPPSGLVVLGDDHDFVTFLDQASRAPVVRVDGRGLDLCRNIARAVGRHMGIPDAAIDDALGRVKLPMGRLNRLEFDGVDVIDDSFNANPMSMKLGLDTLAEARCQRKIAILGHMAELGEEADRYHREIGAYARSRADMVIGVGEAAKRYDPDSWFADSGACAARILDIIRPGDCLLVKGSASAKMGRIIGHLRKSASHSQSG